MTQSFREAQGHSVWYPIAAVLLMLVGASSFVAVFYTMNVRWFLLTLAVVAVLAAAVKR